MEPSFFKIVLLLVLLYAVAPTVVIRLGRIGALSRAPRGRGLVAITFDDGPDPRYTPQILDILGRYKVKACFFVVGSKVRAHPELTRKIVQCGHEVGNHGFRHRIPWFLTPAATTREISETSRAIEELTGQKTRFCRPGWGLFNLFSIWYCHLKGLKVVLWTYMSWDWIRTATPEKITSRVLGRIRDGAILVFHDSDSTPGASVGGPAHVVAALPQILEGLSQRGLRVASLDEVALVKSRRPVTERCLRLIWSFIEPAVRRLAGIRDLNDGKASFWRIALRRYRGKDWQMPDGTVLRAGETYLELHINNDRLMSLTGADMPLERMSIVAMREMRNEMPALVKILSEDGPFAKVNVLLGITLLYRAVGRYGFTSYDMKPGIFSAMTGRYERWLLGLFHPGGFKSLKNYRGKLIPRYVVMTRQELMRRWRQKTEDRNS